MGKPKNPWVIVTPFINKEIPNLYNYLKKILDISKPLWCKPDFLLFFHQYEFSLDHEVKNTLNDLLNDMINLGIIDNGGIRYANLGDQDDIYIRNVNHSGPNNFFFKIIESVKKEEYTKMTIIETDCEILREDWLKNLYSEVSQMKIKDWIIGSPLYFVDTSKMNTLTSLLIKYHLNGNATYNFIHPFFNDTLEKIKNKMIKDQKNGILISYDIAFLKYFIDHKYSFSKNMSISQCICSCCPLEWAKEKGFSICHKPIPK